MRCTKNISLENSPSHCCRSARISNSALDSCFLRLGRSWKREARRLTGHGFALVRPSLLLRKELCHHLLRYYRLPLFSQPLFVLLTLHSIQPPCAPRIASPVAV